MLHFSEQQMVMAANTKVKEIRQQLNEEKMKCQSLEKSYKEKIDYQVRLIEVFVRLESCMLVSRTTKLNVAQSVDFSLIFVLGF